MIIDGHNVSIIHLQHLCAGTRHDVAASHLCAVYLGRHGLSNV